VTPDDVHIYPENRMFSRHMFGPMTGTVTEKDKSCHFFSVGYRTKTKPEQESLPAPGENG